MDFDGQGNNLRVVALANPFTDDQLILPQFVKTIAGVNQLILSESPVGGVFNTSASLDQEGDDRPLLAIGVDDSRLGDHNRRW